MKRWPTEPVQPSTPADSILAMCFELGLEVVWRGNYSIDKREGCD